MKIILPMAGDAAEFKNEFGMAKPLVNICGQEMVERICSMFPQKQSFIFICQKHDLDNEKLETVLENISCYSAKLITVDTLTKNVLESLMFADGSVNEDEDILVVHCDSYSKFDYQGFLEHIKQEQAAGALTVFTGFNPCDKKSSNFGRIAVNETCVTGVFEKSPLKAGQFTAAGCYYFSSWKLFKHYACRLMEQRKNRQQPIFVSEVYNEMLQDSKKVTYYLVYSFINYGTPKDVKEFIYWSEIFSKIKTARMKGKYHDKHNASRGS